MQYLGGKARLGKHLVAAMDFAGCDRFSEPFVGGFNIIPHIPEGIQCAASDQCPGLIAMYRALQDGWLPPESLSEQSYKEIRKFGDIHDPIWAFAGYGCSFGGKLWGGYARNGRGDDYAAQCRRSLIKKIPHIERTIFACCDFDEHYPRHSAVVYCDPPYRMSTGYSGRRFDSGLFERYCTLAAQQGNRVYVSEFEGAYEWPVAWRRERNLDMPSRAKKIEVLMKVPSE